MELKENYSVEKKAIDLTRANVFGLILIFAVGAVSIGLFTLFQGSEALNRLKNFDEAIGGWFILGTVGTVLIVMVLGIVAHELIHGISWAPFASKGYRSIKFGILKEYLTPYCHCKEPLKVKHYIFGAVMPAVVLGFIPLIISFINGSIAWLLFGIFFTAAAGGDFLMIGLLIREARNPEMLVQDHPSEAGFYLYREK